MEDRSASVLLPIMSLLYAKENLLQVLLIGNLFSEIKTIGAYVKVSLIHRFQTHIVWRENQNLPWWEDIYFHFHSTPLPYEQCQSSKLAKNFFIKASSGYPNSSKTVAKKICIWNCNLENTSSIESIVCDIHLHGSWRFEAWLDSKGRSKDVMSWRLFMQCNPLSWG